MKQWLQIVIALSLVLAPRIVFSADVVLLNPEVIGKSLITNQTVLLKATNSEAAVFPIAIDFELRGNTVVGVTLVYPNMINIDDVRNAINRSHGESERKLDYKGVYAWRLSNQQVAMQVGTGSEELTTLVVRSTNKVLFSNKQRGAPENGVKNGGAD
jgi:hypothetical protein